MQDNQILGATDKLLPVNSNIYLENPVLQDVYNCGYKDSVKKKTFFFIACNKMDIAVV